MMEEILVAIIAAGAGIYLVRKFIPGTSGTNNDSGDPGECGGCSSCGEGCACQTVNHRSKPIDSNE